MVSSIDKLFGKVRVGMCKTDVEDRYGKASKEPQFNDALIKIGFQAPSIRIDHFEPAEGSRLAVVYLPEVSSHSTILIIESRIRDIQLSSAEEIQSYLLDNLNTASSVFPLIRKTRRIEMARLALLKGSVLILIDGARYALVAPRTLGQSMLESPRYIDHILPSASKVANYIELFASLFLSSLYIAAFSMPLRWMTSET